MARITHLPSTIHDYDFVKLARTEPHAPTRERLLGMAHLQHHGSLKRTAEALFVSVTSVQNWLNRFRCEGLSGLQEKARPGRSSHLSQEQLPQLAKIIGDLEAEQPGGRVKGKAILARLETTLGVHYHLNALYHLLHRQGWSWITARSRHPDSDPQAQEAFKKTLSLRS